MPSQAEIQTLVEEHLPLVTHVVYQVSVRFPRHVDTQELAHVGALGLLQAAHRYDPDQGVPFQRYAAHRIRGAILDAVRQADWAPRSLRHDARRLEDARQRLASDLGHAPSRSELATELDTTIAALHDLESKVQRSVVLALDDRVAEIEGEETTLGEVLCDRSAPEPDEVLEQREIRGYLRDAVELLPDKHRAVIQGVFLDGVVPQELAEKLGVCVSRISQLRTEALGMLREGIEAQFTDTVDDGRGRVARRKAAYAASIATHSPWRERLNPPAPAPAVPSPSLALA